MDLITSYLRSSLNSLDRKNVIKKLITNIKRAKLIFDAVAFTGMSGALIAPDIADKLKKQLILVRKKDKKHSCYDVEGYYGGSKYIIIDDGISSGDTIKYIKKQIKEAYNFQKYELVGCFTHNESVNLIPRIKDLSEELKVPIYLPDGKKV